MDVSAHLLNLPFTADDYISGERVQKLCEMTVTTRAKIAFHASLDLPRDRLFIFDEEDETAINQQREKIRDAHTVFCYGDLMELFLFTLMVDPCNAFEDGPMKIIVIHNSDQTFEEYHADAFCRHPSVATVFTQNCNAAIRPHKLHAIPIGIANAMWIHGDMSTLHRVREAAAARQQPRNKRPISLYVNLREETNPGHRKDAIDALKNNGFRITSPKLGYMAYLCGLSNSRFVACVRGNGIDSHRIWEALYLGAVPVIEKSVPIYEQFKDVVPMIGIDSWEEVTEEFLAEQEEQLEALDPNCFHPEEALALRGRL